MTCRDALIGMCFARVLLGVGMIIVAIWGAHCTVPTPAGALIRDAGAEDATVDAGHRLPEYDEGVEAYAAEVDCSAWPDDTGDYGPTECWPFDNQRYDPMQVAPPHNSPNFQ